MTERDNVHTLPSGEPMQVTDHTGAPVTIVRPFRFQQGLRPEDAAALDARPDLCAKLWAMNLWAATEDELDAEIATLLQGPPESPPAA